MDTLLSIDTAVFFFINGTLSNPVMDLLWPVITDYDKFLVTRIILVGIWIWLVWKGGRNGRTVAVLLIPLIFISDQLNSSFLKELFGRPRPCHVLDGVHLLVHCGSGKSFPSSHAVNNVAIATLFAAYFPRGKWWFFSAAAVIALSRVGVGVHYPLDLIAGGFVGFSVASLLIVLWSWIERYVSKKRNQKSLQPQP